jgi:hypothetical protein
VTIRVSQRDPSEHFYDLVLETLGREKTHSDGHFAEWDDFSLVEATAANPATGRLHVGFTAPFTDFPRQDSRAHFGHFRGSGASFSVLPGTPTENLHMAFPASTNQIVSRFIEQRRGLGIVTTGHTARGRCPPRLLRGVHSRRGWQQHRSREPQQLGVIAPADSTAGHRVVRPPWDLAPSIRG